MLIQFSVENYRSYKERAIFSMEASVDKELLSNIVVEDKERVLKVAAIFGANASGKSNLFLALTSAILNIRLSNQMQVNQKLFDITPFLFDEKMKDKPTSFEFVFKNNGTKYIYGFSATSYEIVEEYLYAYRTNRPTTIFERDEKEVYRFTLPSIKKELEPLTKKNTKNKLFLATATEWNSKETKEAFDFFSTKINTYSSDYEVLLPQVGPLLDDNNNNHIKDFIKNILKAADINIDDYSFESKEKPVEEFFNSIPLQFRAALQANINHNTKNISYTINTIHYIDNKAYAMNIIEESEGTRNVFGIAPLLKRAFEVTGETICIDEFDRSLHPELVQYLIDLFNDETVNKCNAQLIISTHTTSLLSQEHLRRDQIYFTEKNNETAETELYSLDEFSVRKREDIRKAYLLGRYGAIPNINKGVKL